MSVTTLGAVAAQEIGDAAPSPGGGLPAGAVGMMDFVNGTYLWGGTSYMIADIVDHPEFLIVGGLQIGSGNASPASAEILGVFKTYLIAGDWTVVLELVSNNGTQPFNLSGPTNTLNLQDDDGLTDAVEDLGAVFRYCENTGLGDVGVPRGIGLTRTNAHLAISTDGSAATEDATAASDFGDINTAWLGGFSHSSNDGDCLIGRLVIYPPQSNVNLATLSVPSVM